MGMVLEKNYIFFKSFQIAVVRNTERHVSVLGDHFHYYKSKPWTSDGLNDQWCIFVCKQVRIKWFRSMSFIPRRWLSQLIRLWSGFISSVPVSIFVLFVTLLQLRWPCCWRQAPYLKFNQGKCDLKIWLIKFSLLFYNTKLFWHFKIEFISQ